MLGNPSVQQGFIDYLPKTKTRLVVRNTTISSTRMIPQRVYVVFEGNSSENDEKILSALTADKKRAMKKILISVKELRFYSTDKALYLKNFCRGVTKTSLFLERSSRLHKKNGIVGISSR